MSVICLSCTIKQLLVDGAVVLTRVIWVATRFTVTVLALVVASTSSAAVFVRFDGCSSVRGLTDIIPLAAS
jgi:hypothetical protein